jgi:23S rRNA (cytidine2498-2'-O)-methyltransferase
MATDQDFAGPARLWLATPTFESGLIAELGPNAGARGLPQAPGLVIAREPPSGAPVLDPVFARQQLPAAHAIRAASVAALAEASYHAVEAAVDRAGGTFTVHALTLTGTDPRLQSRCALVAQETLALLRQRRRRSARQFQPAEEAAGQFDRVTALIQILLLDREQGFVSVAAPRPLPAGGWDLAPWPAGLAPVIEDRRPPSRAYRKLEEAFLWMGLEPAPGQLCVDLGGAPGGWTYVALKRGARVVTVDRAPCEPPVLGHPALTMIEGNAFTYAPPQPVDWLLSDIVCEPVRSLTLIKDWLARGDCRHLVVTVKFKGREGYGILADVKGVLAEAALPRYRIKHLHHNKNEVTVFASTAEGLIGQKRDG